MFNSFFPSPRKFLLSAIGWFFASLLLWYGLFDGLAEQFSLMREEWPTEEGKRPPFLNPDKVWLYQYIVIVTALFCVAWFFIERNRWYWWAVCGSGLILLVTYFQVQLGVYINNWYGDFYDLIQLALSERGVSNVSLGEYYGQLLTLLYILIPNILLLVLFAYFTRHYVFRWRTAMNEYYMTHWGTLRTIEGAAQRVQEDTMRFASIVEGLGSHFISSIMTLIAFLPLLWNLSKEVTELPLIGAVNGSLLVYGEDNEARAAPPTVNELFRDVRKNYFKLYFNYLYFDVFRYAYLQGANFIPLIALGPTFVAGAITFGIYQQINQAFSRVENSFQFLVNSWTTIIELMSIHKRLKQFEEVIEPDQMDSTTDVILSS